MCNQPSSTHAHMHAHVDDDKVNKTARLQIQSQLSALHLLWLRGMLLEVYFFYKWCFLLTHNLASREYNHYKHTPCLCTTTMHTTNTNTHMQRKEKKNDLPKSCQNELKLATTTININHRRWQHPYFGQSASTTTPSRRTRHSSAAVARSIHGR